MQNTDFGSEAARKLWEYSSNITQSFFCITLICTIITDLKFVDAGREQVSEHAVSRPQEDEVLSLSM